MERGIGWLVSGERPSQVPAIILGMLGIDERYQGMGLRAQLLCEAILNSLARGLSLSIRRGRWHGLFAADSFFSTFWELCSWFCDLNSPRLISGQNVLRLRLGNDRGAGIFMGGRHARNRVVFISLGRGCGAEGKMAGNRTSLTWSYARVPPAAFLVKGEWLPPGAPVDENHPISGRTPPIFCAHLEIGGARDEPPDSCLEIALVLSAISG